MVEEAFATYNTSIAIEANAIGIDDDLNNPHGDSVTATICAVTTKAAFGYQTKEQLEGAV